MMMNNSVKYIQADDLVKVFRLGNVEVQALRGLSMRVDEGEMVAIVITGLVTYLWKYVDRTREEIE